MFVQMNGHVLFKRGYNLESARKYVICVDAFCGSVDSSFFFVQIIIPGNKVGLSGGRVKLFQRNKPYSQIQFARKLCCVEASLGGVDSSLFSYDPQG